MRCPPAAKANIFGAAPTMAPLAGAIDVALNQPPGADRRRHQSAVGGVVIQLAAVATPLRSVPTQGRDLTLAAAGRKGVDVDLVTAGLVGRIGHPLAVW